MLFSSILSQIEVLKVTGVDAKDFLNRLTTTHFKALHVGDATSGCLLQATGRILSYFEVLNPHENEFFLLCHPMSKTTTSSSKETFEHLDKLFFRENLKLEPLEQSKTVLRLYGDATLESAFLNAFGFFPDENEVKEHDDALVFNWGKWIRAPLSFDLGLVIDSTHLTKWERKLEDLGFQMIQDFHPYRVYSKDPWGGYEITPQGLPFEAGVENALHENKGCYPGQEVVERIRSMGEAPKKLGYLEADSFVVVDPSTPLINTEKKELGRITSSAVDPFHKKSVALAVIPKVNSSQENTFFIGEKQVSLEILTRS